MPEFRQLSRSIAVEIMLTLRNCSNWEMQFSGLASLTRGGSDMCLVMTHCVSLCFRFSFDKATTEADLFLIIDRDVPSIPSRNPPHENARISHIDGDPLNCMMLTPILSLTADGKRTATPPSHSSTQNFEGIQT